MLIWLRNYRRDLLAGDIGAGIIVTLMMIPQSMAYALVAGLPPVTGLYASILPPVAYACSAAAWCSRWGRWPSPR
jgi:SulP family sulfate permease